MRGKRGGSVDARLGLGLCPTARNGAVAVRRAVTTERTRGAGAAMRLAVGRFAAAYPGNRHRGPLARDHLTRSPVRFAA